MLTPAMPETRQLRSRHWSRYLDGGMISVWLIFWLVGELIALALIVLMIASGVSAALGRPSMLASWAPATDGSVSIFLLFLAVWTLLWTLAGMSAITHLLRRVAGEDVIEVSPEGIRFTWRGGPIRRHYDIPKASIRRVRLRSSDSAVVADTETGTTVISDLATPEEHESVRSWLAARLGLTDEDRAVQRERDVPPRERDVETAGVTSILTHPTRSTRVLRAQVVMALAALMSLGWIDAFRRGSVTSATAGESAAMAATLLVAGCAIWFLTATTEWIITPGQLVVRRRVRSWTFRERTFGASATLHIEHHRDSDGDDRYSLVVRDGPRRRILETAVFDGHELFALGEWLAGRTGFPFERPEADGSQSPRGGV